MTRLTLLLFVLAAWPAATPLSAAPEITRAQAREAGMKLWQNECGGTVEGLTSWNKGEDFASLGIGHFIWYPPGMEGPFDESFPKVLTFIRSHGAKVPAWLLETPDCPWTTLAAFEADRHSDRMNSLRLFLRDTIDLQALFAARRLQEALPKMTAGLSPEEAGRVRRQFDRVAAHPHGIYVLVDYVNFKGEGIKESERYHGQGWGLLQVLQQMRGTAPGAPALAEFSDAAVFVLTRRVENSPPARGEKRWLAGWTNRCRTYRAPQ